MKLLLVGLLVLLPTVWTSYARSEVSGASPCGDDAKIGLPPGTSISTDDGGVSTMSIRGSAGTAHLRLPGLIDAVEQVCEVPGAKLLVFGKSGRGVYNIEIVNLHEPTLQDSIYGYTPLLSPDQRWIIWRKFYPVQAPSPTEEYLMYDLTKDSQANRAAGIRLDDPDSLGSAVYPVVKNGRPFENGVYPPAERHNFRAQSFYWAADSSAVIFADSLERGPLMLVLVSIGDGEFTTYIHPVSVSDVCDSPGPLTTASVLKLIRANMSRGSNGVREVESSFSEDGGGPCNAHTLALPQSAFQRAPTVVPVEARRKPSVREQ
jgi:hypothetical protein